MSAWKGAECAYRQYTKLLNGCLQYNVFEITALTDLRSVLAERLKRVLVAYNAREEQFATDFLHRIAEIDGSSGRTDKLFHDYYTRPELEKFFSRLSAPADARRAGTRISHIIPRRSPPVFETVHETCRRLVLLRQFVTAARESTSAVVLGGSLSYGKFYNLRGDCDIDLFIVVDSGDGVVNLAKSLLAFRYFRDDATKLFLKRAQIYARLEKEAKCDMISQKLTVIETPSFDVSLHIVNKGAFLQIALADRNIPKGKNPSPDFVRDYRVTAGPAQDYFQKSFDGSFLHIASQSKNAPEGFIAKVPSCAIRDGRFYLGVHHNLLLPMLEFRHESPPNQYRFSTSAFKAKVLERLEQERHARPYESLRLSYAFTRSQDFSPSIRKRADTEMLHG